MKKNLMILACACFVFAACDELGLGTGNDQTADLEELPDIVGNENNAPTEELAPAEQQAKLQSVGEKMLAEFPAEAFQNLADISKAFDQTYGYNENYDLSELEKWAENSVSVAYSHNHKDLNGESHYGYCKKNILLLLSNHTGLFTFGANKVTVAPYKGTKAVFTVKGKTYEAEITSSGKVTNAYFEYYYHNEYGYNYDTNNDGIINRDDQYEWDSETKVTLGVPEEINISITENGAPLAVVNAAFSVSVSPDEFQFSTDAFATEFSAVINGYELKVSKTGYEGPASKTQMMTTLSNGSKTLLTYTASADLHLKTEVLSGSYNNSNPDAYDNLTSKEVVVEKFENFKVALDILGEIQVMGTCSDINKLNNEIELVNRALDDRDWETGNQKPIDEITAAKHTKNVNNLIDLGVYYDKGCNKQADIEFEYYYEKEIFYDYWGNEVGVGYSRGFYPVIVFNNGNRNKIEDFFTENAFSSLFESLEEFIESYNTVFGYYTETEKNFVPINNYVY